MSESQKVSIGKKGGSFSPYRTYVFLALSIIVLSVISFFIYKQIQWTYQQSLQDQIRGITQTAVMQFDTNILDKINGRESVNSQEYRAVVLKMQELKMQNPSVRFIDIYRRTDQPHLFEYIADANSLNPHIPVDDNGDGIIDEMDEPIWPGDIYDGSVAPEFVVDAFVRSNVSDFLEESQWGYTLDGSSPIFDGKPVTDYALNISVDATEFKRRIDRAFIPFVLFTVIVLINLIILTLSLEKVWRARVEFLAELDRQKDELLSIVSHQLATPVSSLKWYMEMLLDGDLGKISKEQKEHISTMVSVGVNLSDLIGMILDVSRIQLGRMKVEKQELDLDVFFNEILEIIIPKAKAKEIKFDMKIPKKFPKAMLDKRYTFMVIENLLTNAIKYTPEKGRVSLSVEIIGKSIHCVVSDSGCGIPEKDQDQIFGKLFRASNVRNSVEGNGFGLFVAKGAVEAQGGKISFLSKENKGTTFIVDLPLQGEASGK